MQKRWGMAIKVDSCFACKFCVLACKSENDVDLISYASEIAEDSPAFCAGIPGEVSGDYRGFTTRCYPVICRHCQNPVCLESCAAQAIFKRPDGIVVISQKDCNGCGACVKACPYQVPQLDLQTGKVEMCDLCVHRVEEGKEPMCVRACPVKALVFGDLNDEGTEISRLIAGRKPLELPQDARNQPSVYFLTKRERSPHSM